MSSLIFINRFAWPDHSATSQLLSDLAAGLAERGLRVVLIASRLRYDDEAARLAPFETWRGVAIERIATTGFGRGNLLGRALDYLSFYLSLSWRLWRQLERGDVVVAKTDPPLIGLVVAAVARLRGAVFVQWLQDVFPEVAVELGQPRLPRALVAVLGWLRDLSLGAAAINVVIGDRMAATLRGRGVAADRLRVIPNWAHEDVIEPRPANQSRLRAALGLGEHFVVGYSGNLGRAHDTDALFDAARRLAAEPKIAFLVIGAGYGYRALQARCQQAGLQNIHFLPYQPRASLADAMAASDLHLVSLAPALEGLIVPSKFYGIAAAARPIGFIGSADGELGQLISRHQCGFTVPWADGLALASEIQAAAADPARGLVQGQNAFALLGHEYSRALAHARWHDLITSLSKSSAAAPAARTGS